MRWLLLSVFVVLIDAQESGYVSSAGAAAYKTGAKTGQELSKVSGDANRFRAQEALLIEDDPLSGYGREGAQGGKTKHNKGESESIFSVEPVGVRYKVDSATSELTKEVAYAKKPPVAPPRAKVPPVTGKSPLKYPAHSSIPSSESSMEPEPTQEETAPPSLPNVPSPAYPVPTSSKEPDVPEEGPSSGGPSEVAPPASAEGKDPGPSQVRVNGYA
ncbi:hypothetical protein ANCCAN_10326 [Ancylostoma caninum]|uniref:Uncharacterized protein n=1 Tax=Ancylostoma caninum TaxID=29170 RepID=A0A368GH45_ANCCA|nr:hypothetical protein ANCCAN_10326 [Ancylostoma caninum]